MKKLEKYGSYQIIQEKHGLGLIYAKYDVENISGEPEGVYKDILLIPPRHSSLTIKYPPIDLDYLFQEQQSFIEEHFIRLCEDGCSVIEADGKHGFLYAGEIIPDFTFDTILKLSFRHYLCKKENYYTFYRFTDTIYDRNERPYLKPLFSFEADHSVTLTSLMELMSSKYVDEYQDFLKQIRPYGNCAYLSEFRYFSAYVDDVHFTWAVEKTILQNDFSYTSHDLKYGALARG